MFINVLVSIVIAGIIGLGLFGLRGSNRSFVKEVGAKFVNASQTTDDSNADSQVRLVPDFSAVKAKVENYIGDSKGEYGVYFRDLDSSASWGIDDDRVFTAASTMKVLAVAGLYKRVEEGEVSLDDIVYGVSLREYARLALEVSDNNAWDIINSTVGFNYLQSLADQLDMKNTDATVNTTSAHDFGLLLESLYRGDLLTQSDSKEVLGFMKQTETETRIPAGVDDALNGQAVEIYHKTGTLDQLMHDGGVIVSPNGKYILTIYSNEIDDSEDVRTSKLRDISKLVWDGYLEAVKE